MTRVAVVPIPAMGHVNPLLAVTAALVAHPGAQVVSVGSGEFGGAFQRAGATHVAIRPVATPAPPTGLPAPSALAAKSFVGPLGDIEPTIDAIARFAPDVVLYDVFSLHGFLAARALGLPAASLVTFPGYGALGEAFLNEHATSSPALRWANDRYLERFGVDVLGEGHLPVLFPAAELSIVSAVELLSRSVRGLPKLSRLLSDHERRCEYVGPCLGDVRADPPSRGEVVPGSDGRTADLPIVELEEGRRTGRRIILFSLGTVLTDFRFDSPVGGAPSGRQFLVTMLRRLVEALGDDPTCTVVIAVGTLLSAEDEPSWPANFLVRDFVPQRLLLDRLVDVFITHHGANSTSEAILAEVPMVSVPGVGDQLAGAELTVAAGAAIALWDLHDPYRTCTAALLRRAVYQAMDQGHHRTAIRTLRSMIDDGGGAKRAADLVLALAR